MQWTFNNDPFPGIQPALLNSADIQAYQDACGLITGETFSLDRLKPASYEIRFVGDIYWWDLRWNITGPRRHRRIESEGSFEIKKNSIVYVAPDAIFTLPDFMAMRFNLRINLVHRGLLLGTGPLVDPGFQGRLLIPMHNLTSEDINVDGKDGLIWVEFTKISPLTNAATASSTHGGQSYAFKPFPQNKKNLQSLDYFKSAGGGPFRSSLVDLLIAAKDAERTVSRWAIVGILGVAVGISALILTAHGLSVQAENASRSASQWVSDSNNEFAKRHKEDKDRTDGLSGRVDALEAKTAALIKAGESERAAKSKRKSTPSKPTR